VPRIKRFHPIAHDFNRDPEVRELRGRFGDWMALAWVEMLSISDRNEGVIRGGRKTICETISRVSTAKYLGIAAETVNKALAFMEEKGWILIGKDEIRVTNYADYHPRREQASSLLPSLLPSLQKDRPPKGGLVPELTPTELMESWNEICGSEGLPRIEQQTNGRKAKAKARLKTFPKSEFWGRVLNGIIESDYLMGRRRKEGDTWKPDFDWLVRNDENPAKVMEGKYD